MAIGLVLGGGAPNLTLMTGALLALDEAGVEFKVITTTGAGMVVGLIYAAPREEEGENWVDARRRLLRGTRDWGIDDAIYRNFPVNYKIFHKPGQLAQEFSRATVPFLWAIPRNSRRQRLLGDTLAFWASIMSPSNLTPSSHGLCQPPPWIDHIVDFPKLRKNLKRGDRKFRLSAYCIDTDEQMPETFDKDEITEEHFRGALAMPFIYEPYKLWDPKEEKFKSYIEGSALDTLEFNPENVMADNEIDTIVYFDLMGNRDLIGQPRWLLDAWGKSIVAPLTRIAEQDVAMFKHRREVHRKHRQMREGDAPSAGNGEDPHHYIDRPKDLPRGERSELLRMEFRKEIPEKHIPYMLDWSHSNMAFLFDCGYQAGRRFLWKHWDRLKASIEDDDDRDNGSALNPAFRPEGPFLDQPGA